MLHEDDLDKDGNPPYRIHVRLPTHGHGRGPHGQFNGCGNQSSKVTHAQTVMTNDLQIWPASEVHIQKGMWIPVSILQGQYPLSKWAFGSCTAFNSTVVATHEQTMLEMHIATTEGKGLMTLTMARVYT